MLCSLSRHRRRLSATGSLLVLAFASTALPAFRDVRAGNSFLLTLALKNLGI